MKSVRHLLSIPGYRIPLLAVLLAGGVVLAAAAPGKPVAPVAAVRPPVAALAAGIAGMLESNDVIRVTSSPQNVSLLLSRSAVLSFEAPIERLAVGDPTVAKVTVVNDNEFLVNARTAGSTNIVVWTRADGAQSSTTTFVELRVEFDLQPLRDHLRGIHPAIEAESSPLGNAVILRGRVPNRIVMALAIEATDQYLRGIAGDAQIQSNPVIETGSASTAAPAGDPPAGASGDPRIIEGDGAADVSREGDDRIKASKVINMMTLEVLPAPLEDVMQREMNRLEEGIHVRRLQIGDVPDDALDTFVLEGAVRSGATLTRALAIGDRLLGGNGENFTVLADQGGVLTQSRSEQGALSSGGSTGGARLANGSLRSNIRSNLPRGLVVTAASGRLVSFLKVIDIPQVLIAVRIVEINRTLADELGIDWRFDTPGFSFINRNGLTGAALPDPRSGLLGDIGRANDAFVAFSNNHGFSFAVRWLESRGLARTLAEPNLVAMSGEVASFVVGGEVPIQTTTSTVTAAFQGFDFREFGIRLDIRPTVSEDGLISLEVTPQVSTPEFTPGLGAPSFSIRSLSTVSQLREGEALIVGGLINKSKSHSTSQTPFLGDIPIIGALFSNRNQTDDESELAIMLTPQIVRPKPAAELLAELPPLNYPIRPGKWIGLDQPIPEDELPDDTDWYLSERAPEAKHEDEMIEEEPMELEEEVESPWVNPPPPAATKPEHDGAKDVGEDEDGGWVIPEGDRPEDESSSRAGTSAGAPAAAGSLPDSGPRPVDPAKEDSP